MRTLVVVRHAKAESPHHVADFDRPLSARGVRDAQVAGKWLRRKAGRPDLVLSSPARRAVGTAETLLGGYDEPRPPVRLERPVYEATVEDLLPLLRDLAADVAVAVLVGHNPAVSRLAATLTGQDVALRTCGIAVVQTGATWAELAPAGCTLELVETPRA